VQTQDAFGASPTLTGISPDGHVLRVAHCRDIVVVLTPEMLREVFGVTRRVELGLALFL